MFISNDALLMVIIFSLLINVSLEFVLIFFSAVYVDSYFIWDFVWKNCSHEHGEKAKTASVFRTVGHWIEHCPPP